MLTSTRFAATLLAAGALAGGADTGPTQAQEAGGPAPQASRPAPSSGMPAARARRESRAQPRPDQRAYPRAGTPRPPIRGAAGPGWGYGGYSGYGGYGSYRGYGGGYPGYAGYGGGYGGYGGWNWPFGGFGALPFAPSFANYGAGGCTCPGSYGYYQPYRQAAFGYGPYRNGPGWRPRTHAVYEEGQYIGSAVDPQVRLNLERDFTEE